MDISNIGNYGNMNIYGNTYGTHKNRATETALKLSANSTIPTGKNEKKTSSDNYFESLKKLVPSCKMSIGNGLSGDKNSKTVTINPKILDKMQNDPKQEKDTTNLIKGIETAMKLSESMAKSSGGEIKYSHWYVDENGKCWHSAMYVKKDKLNEKLREKSKKMRKDLMEHSKFNTAKKKEELQKSMEKITKKKKEAAKKKEAHEELTDIQTTGETTMSIAEKIMENKISDSENGIFSFTDDDVKKFAEAAKEDENFTEQEFLKKHLNLKA